MIVKEKAQPTKPIRVSEKVHNLVKRKALELEMTMQDVIESAIAKGMPSDNPKQPGYATWIR